MLYFAVFTLGFNAGVMLTLFVTDAFKALRGRGTSAFRRHIDRRKGIRMRGKLIATLVVLAGLSLGTVLPVLATAPNPALNLSHIACVEDGSVEVHFVLTHASTAGSPLAVEFLYPVGSAAPGPHTGDTWHFYAYYPSGTTFNLLVAAVGVPSAWPGPTIVLAGPSIDDYNGTYDCGGEDPTPTAEPTATPTTEPTTTQVPTPTETPVVTEPPFDPTATPTETPVVTEPPFDPTETPVITEPPFDPTPTERPPTGECEGGSYHVWLYQTDEEISWYFRNGQCQIYTRGYQPSVEDIGRLCDVECRGYRYDGRLIAHGVVEVDCYGNVTSQPEWLYRTDAAYAFGADALYGGCDEASCQ